jgi:putative ABC transport system substrate-binding protein
VNVIYAAGPAAVRAAQHATRTIPIVATTSDLVALGLIASLAKPGGNITGVSLLVPELDAKKLEVLKEIVPARRRFGLLSDPATSESAGLQKIADTHERSVSSFRRRRYGALTSYQPLLPLFRPGGAQGCQRSILPALQ